MSKNFYTSCAKITIAALVLVVVGFLPVRSWADDLIINRVSIAEVPPDFGVKPQGITVKISWFTTVETYGEVDFGTTANYTSIVGSSLTPSIQHEIQIGGLKGETTYHFKIVARTAFGTKLDSFDQSFKTSKFVDTTAPVISNVRVTYAGGTYFIVTWMTDKPTDARVEYSTDPSLARPASAGGSWGVTAHEVLAGGLRKNTLYYFRVTSVDRDGNRAVQSSFSVITASSDVGDNAPLVISQVSPVSWPDPLITPTTITFTWHTNQPSRGSVNVRGANGRRVDEVTFLGVDHTTTATGLKPDSVYVISISANDGLRHSATLGDITLRTAALTPIATPPSATAPKPQVKGESVCGAYAYGICRNFQVEQNGASALRTSLQSYFRGRVPATAQSRWYTWVNAYVYGGYPVAAIARAIQGYQTVHVGIPWNVWRTSPDYLRTQ